jgi:hypothetical protein
MSKTFHRVLKFATGMDDEWEEYAENVGKSVSASFSELGSSKRV